MSDPLISVVIPHLNQPDHLRVCLDSLARQTFDMSRVEIIVVDNGSRELPAGTCSAFNGVCLVEELTPGPGPARNLGVKVSSGEILAFIDADCTADPDWLAVIAAALTGTSRAKVIGGDVRIARRDPQRATMIEAYESIYAYRQEEYITRDRYSGTGNLAMRREIYDAVGPFCGIERAEDRDWGRRATRLGFAVCYVPDMIVYHPARRTFAELCTKWDRHISHAFAEDAHGLIGRLRWLGLTAAVAGSPLFEVRRILTSPRVATKRERLSAAVALVKIRMHRASRMLAVLVGGTSARSSRQWNRT
jgi:glycosyltransferase involved in cell wall biosynthesis